MSDAPPVRAQDVVPGGLPLAQEALNDACSSQAGAHHYAQLDLVGASAAGAAPRSGAGRPRKLSSKYAEHLATDRPGAHAYLCQRCGRPRDGHVCPNPPSQQLSDTLALPSTDGANKHTCGDREPPKIASPKSKTQRAPSDRGAVGKSCKRCGELALVGNYGFCASHRGPAISVSAANKRAASKSAKPPCKRPLEPTASTKKQMRQKKPTPPAAAGGKRQPLVKRAKLTEELYEPKRIVSQEQTARGERLASPHEPACSSHSNPFVRESRIRCPLGGFRSAHRLFARGRQASGDRACVRESVPSLSGSYRGTSSIRSSVLTLDGTRS